jgi:oligoribonuclease (3'-5' exoribonuclease)
MQAKETLCVNLSWHDRAGLVRRAYASAVQQAYMARLTIAVLTEYI